MMKEVMKALHQTANQAEISSNLTHYTAETGEVPLVGQKIGSVDRSVKTFRMRSTPNYM